MRSWSGCWYFGLLIAASLLIFKYQGVPGFLTDSDNPDSVIVPISEIMSGEPIVLGQDDSRVISYIIRKQFIHKPDVELEYNLKFPDKDPSMGQGQLIRKLLNNMTGGFFLESGAFDGETRSNTLFLEKHLNWRGLLVEGDPLNFSLLRRKNRRAFTSNTCLAVQPFPHVVTYLEQYLGKSSPGKDSKSVTRQKISKVQCMPVYSLLTALNTTHVDYFSLNVDGNELKVLKTIPFEKVFIRTLSVEFSRTFEGKKELKDFMTSKGFKVYAEVRHPQNIAHDFIFIHKYSGISIS